LNEIGGKNFEKTPVSCSCEGFFVFEYGAPAQQTPASAYGTTTGAASYGAAPGGADQTQTQQQFGAY